MRRLLAFLSWAPLLTVWAVLVMLEHHDDLMWRKFRRWDRQHKKGIFR